MNASTSEAPVRCARSSSRDTSSSPNLRVQAPVSSSVVADFRSSADSVRRRSAPLMGAFVAASREILVGSVLILIRASLIAFTGGLVVVRPRLILITHRLVVIRQRLILIRASLIAFTGGLVVVRPRLIPITHRLVVIRQRLILSTPTHLAPAASARTV